MKYGKKKQGKREKSALDVGHLLFTFLANHNPRGCEVSDVETKKTRKQQLDLEDYCQHHENFS